MTLSEFFFKVPLYKKEAVVQLQNTNEFEYSLSYQTIKDIFNGNVERIPSIEGYNAYREYDSTFIVTRINIWDNFAKALGGNNVDNEIIRNGGTDVVLLTCRRTGDKFHFLLFWNPKDSSIMKVGQYPSYMDIHRHDTDKYASVLDRHRLRELVRAIGLHANGVGIGAFVYLRRIFEYLIREAFIELEQSSKTEGQEFERSRMDEKINMVKNYLPEFLVQNRSIYSILSKGIHELGEEDCLEYFDIVKSGIEIILDQKLEMLLKKKKEEEAKQKLAVLTSKLSK